MTDIRSRLADALRESLAPWITGFCSGAEIDVDEDYLLSLTDELSDEITGELLSLPGIAITLLPEPDYFSHWDVPSCGEFNGKESTGDSVVSVEIKEDGIEADTFGEMTPLESQLLAAALLAAAVQEQEDQ